MLAGLCLIYRPVSTCYLITYHFNIPLRSSCSQEISSEVLNADDFSITFHDTEGKNTAEKKEVMIH